MRMNIPLMAYVVVTRMRFPAYTNVAASTLCGIAPLHPANWIKIIILCHLHENRTKILVDFPKLYDILVLLMLWKEENICVKMARQKVLSCHLPLPLMHTDQCSKLMLTCSPEESRKLTGLVQLLG